MLHTIRPPRPLVAAADRMFASNVSPQARRQASTHIAPLLVHDVKVARNWRDSLDIAPIAATFARATQQAYTSGNGALIRIALPKNNRSLRHNLDELMRHMQDAAATELELDLAWEPASADMKATMRQALIVPKR